MYASSTQRNLCHHELDVKRLPNPAFSRLLCAADKRQLCALAIFKTQKLLKPESRRTIRTTTSTKIAPKRREVKSSPRKVIRCPAPFLGGHHFDDNRVAPKRNQDKQSLKDVSAHSSGSSSPIAECSEDGGGLYMDERFGKATAQDPPTRWFTDSLEHRDPRYPFEPLGRYTLRDEKDREVMRSTRIAKATGR